MAINVFSEEGQNSGYIQEMYQLYVIDPALVGKEWSAFFGNSSPTAVPPAPREVKAVNGHTPAPAAEPRVEALSEDTLGQFERMLSLVAAFRTRGHLAARVNPVSRGVKHLPGSNDLHLEHYGFQSGQLDRELPIPGFGSISPRHLLTTLQSLYCGSIGFEFMHCNASEERLWLQQRVEARRAELSAEAKRHALKKLVYAETLENELHRKFVGLKRFSVEGGETVVPMIDRLLEFGAEQGVRSVVVGMAHRGRLNVLCNNLGKPLSVICSEFEDHTSASKIGAGDVKYHIGHRGTVSVSSGLELEVELLSNPSHLEFVNPVVEGVVRAKQDRSFPENRSAVLPVVIHGDAAFAGQGIVFETINFSNTKAYHTAGTFHLVINNQVGFTTNPDDSRSSEYCTDMARGVGIPVLHVNAEDTDAALWATSLALEYRQQFRKDIIIDLICYRKYGHNEGDDPTFTQPILYSELKGKDSIPSLYAQALVAEGIVDSEEYGRLTEEYQRQFAAAQEDERRVVPGAASPLYGKLGINLPPAPTGVSEETLKELAELSIDHPADVVVLPKLKKILEKRVEAVRKGEGIDWGFAEVLAFASLAKEGTRVRLSGQDCGRGTFSQRHINLSNTQKMEYFCPYSRVKGPRGACIEVYNSTLSEAAVVGFEYGYALENAEALVLWEAQFGDFSNGAQVILDQFLASSEAKWGQCSGVTLLLPHGFEGQGPEHSSARIERYLQMCAEQNMTICVCSNAKQHFHLLRRQGLAQVKRPLIAFTPKSLLRNPEAAASLDELVAGEFEPVIVEDFGSEEQPQHALVMSGKVYYDVVAELQKHEKHPTIRVVRLEQVYPLPEAQLSQALSGIPRSGVVWVQEEPRNMGVWPHISAVMREQLDIAATYVGRTASPVTATGSHHRHEEEQHEIVKAALSLVGVAVS